MLDPYVWQSFPSLAQLENFAHAFTLRHPEIDVGANREEALARLWDSHLHVVEQLGFSPSDLVRAEQVHGKNVGVASDACGVVPVTDGLISNQSGIMLGIYVADCCAVYLVDPVSGAFGIVHSGKNGTALGITTVAIEKMRRVFGARAENLIVQLSPCIRPPAYEIDFAATIREQARTAGVLPQNIHDDGTCTTSDLTKYYSYRAEKGKTGRMLALLGKKHC